MGMLGIFLLCALLIFLIATIGDLDSYYVVVVLAFFFIGLIVYDATSPTEIEESFIITNDFNKYGLHVDSENPMKVKVVKKDTTRFGAIFTESTVYTLIIED